jgi:outer membrane assembly lipoprotein YfiO
LSVHEAAMVERKGGRVAFIEGSRRVGGGERGAESRFRAPGPFPAGRAAGLGSSVLILTLFLSAACGRFDPSQYPTPEALFDASLEKYHNGDCGAAELGFQRLAFEFPARDPRRAQSRYYLAECLQDSKRYLEAAREYRRVADQHAQDSLAPIALLRMGEAYTKLWRRDELDATYGLSALTVLQELQGRYPSSASAQTAQAHIEQLNERFAHKEYKTGIYYLRARAYDSAIIYFRSVVLNWPQSSWAPEALLKLVEAYDRIDYEEDKNDMCGQLERFYPDMRKQAEACSRDTSSVTLSR